MLYIYGLLISEPQVTLLRFRFSRGVVRDPANGAIPVVSASGVSLAPCKPAKMFGLLKSGKAVVKWNSDGSFSLQLKFDPKSPIRLPGARATLSKTVGGKPAGIWSSAEPTRAFIEGLWHLARHSKKCLESLSEDERLYFNVLLGAEWSKINDPKVLEKVTPIAMKILDAYAEASPQTPTQVHESLANQSLAENDGLSNRSFGDEDLLSLENLVRARSLGRRNGAYYKLGSTREEGILNRSLLNAAIGYLAHARRIGRAARIACEKLRQTLEQIVLKLQGRRFMLRNTILKKGLEKASQLLQNCRTILTWAPQILSWLKMEAYILWLGTGAL